MRWTSCSGVFFFVYETTPHTLIQRLGATNYYETGQVIGDTLG